MRAKIQTKLVGTLKQALNPDMLLFSSDGKSASAVIFEPGFSLSVLFAEHPSAIIMRTVGLASLPEGDEGLRRALALVGKITSAVITVSKDGLVELGLPATIDDPESVTAAFIQTVLTAKDIKTFINAVLADPSLRIDPVASFTYFVERFVDAKTDQPREPMAAMVM